MWRDAGPVSSFSTRSNNAPLVTSTGASTISSPKLQWLLRVDWSSLGQVACILDAVVSLDVGRDGLAAAGAGDHDTAMIANEVLQLLLVEVPEEGSTSSTVSAPLLLVRASLREALQRIEREVHPALGQQEQHQNIMPTKGAHHNGEILLCPICNAASCGSVRLLGQLMQLSSAPCAHSIVAARGSLWSGETGTTEYLYRTFVHSSGCDEAHALPRFVTGQARWLAEWIADSVTSQSQQHRVPLGTGNDSSNITYDDAGDQQHSFSTVDEDLPLCTLHLLFKICGTDDDAASSVALLLVNTPHLAAKGGTLIHVIVAAELHQCLRLILEQLELSTRAQRRSLRSISRVHALRCDSLNRSDINGATPLSIAIGAHDHTAARLLLLHGASMHTAARVRPEDVAYKDPRELLVLHRCSHNMQRLFFPLTVDLNAAERNPSAPPPHHINLPALEYLDESLQRSLEACLCRSSVGELLLGVGRRLVEHVNQLQQRQEGEGHARYVALRDTTLRSYIASLHADPWNMFAAQELDALLQRHFFVATAPEGERRTAQQISGILNRGILAFQRGPSSRVAPMDVVVLPATVPESDDHLPRVHRSPSMAGPSVLCDDRRALPEGSNDASTITHVRVLCPIAMVSNAEATPARGKSSRSCLVLWVRLSPLMGSIPLHCADDDLVEGHGFVEGITAPGCPIHADDLIVFARSAGDHRDDGVVFVATRCVQEGSVRISHPGKTSHTLRRVRCGPWTQQEDPINFPDPTLWMDNKQLHANNSTVHVAGGGGILRHICNNAVQWRQLQENVLRVDSRYSFWALQEGGLTGGSLETSQILCTPLPMHTPSTSSVAAAAASTPWLLDGWFAVVDSRSDNLVALIPSFS